METEETRHAAIQAVLDKQEIYDALARFCRALDRCDEALLRTIYHPDGVHLHALGPEISADEYVEMAMAGLRGVGPVSHQLLNVLIELHGDTAYSEAYCLVFHRLEKDGAPFDCIIGSRMLDRWERRVGSWKIARGRVVFDWNQDMPSCETWAKRLFPGAGSSGRKDKTDPSYQFVEPDEAATTLFR